MTPYIRNNKAGKKGFRICKLCKQPYPAVSIGPMKFKPHTDSQECMDKLFKLANQKLVKEGEKRKREERMELKAKIIKWDKKLQSKVQEIARWIDWQQPCLARNYVPKQSHGGHLFSRAGSANIKVNLHNIFLQAAQSNHYQNDDGLMRDGCIRVFGRPYFDFITGLKSTPLQRYNNEEYREFYQKACKIANRMKKNLVKNETQDRIRLRNEINLELRFYPEDFCVFK